MVKKKEERSSTPQNALALFDGLFAFMIVLTLYLLIQNLDIILKLFGEYQSYTWMVYANYGVVFFLYIAVPLFFLWRRKFSYIQEFWNAKTLGSSLSWWILLMIVIFPIYLLGLDWITHHFYCGVESSSHHLAICKPWHFSQFPLPSFQVFVIWFVITLLLIALPEEFFYRGFLQTCFKKVSSAWVAVVLTSFLFGLFHV